MAENVDNSVLEHLRHIPSAVDAVRLDIIDLKTRMTAVEITLAQVSTLMAAQSGRMDRFDERLGRIERRLDLAEA